MDLRLQIKDLARLLNVTPDTIINWELRNVKPVEKNLTTVRQFLDSKEEELASTEIVVLPLVNLLGGLRCSHSFRNASHDHCPREWLLLLQKDHSG